jgi:hypothetical protein
MPRLRAITLLSLATSLFVPAGIAQNTNTARPGTINYVEGQATINGQMLTAKSVGSAEVAQGQTVSTTNGKVEILMTPGVFLLCLAKMSSARNRAQCLTVKTAPGSCASPKFDVPSSD